MEPKVISMSGVLNEVNEDVAIVMNANRANCFLTKTHDKDGLAMYRFKLESETSFIPEPIE